MNYQISIWVTFGYVKWMQHNTIHVPASLWQWSFGLASMSEILEMQVNSYETANATFWKTSYNFMLRYFVKSCIVIRNFVVNSFAPSSSSSGPRFQGFFNTTIENYANFFKSFSFIFIFRFIFLIFILITTAIPSNTVTLQWESALGIMNRNNAHCLIKYYREWSKCPWGITFINWWRNCSKRWSTNFILRKRGFFMLCSFLESVNNSV